MSSEKPLSAPPGSATSLTDTDRDSHPPPGATAQPPQGAAGAGCAPAAERMVSAAGSMVLPAGVINPTVPIRNIQMKFAVVVGLIQVGEVSNRDIVETVLNLESDVSAAVARLLLSAVIQTAILLFLDLLCVAAKALPMFALAVGDGGGHTGLYPTQQS
ncbi:Neurobeachin Lysosomal-trafficking regulator 2 [Takifugu flavidus]|uniref:Neurobeachin Lysosomal-trafficking regulator 2 n=1 Tax=Takifugu flavidus TaxID=433684 RepID=A0A5C6P701_9TELE|nr:Neurobeachin Lysosomal-trafficking regulator 2 [Takifugu flavidus]